MKSKIFWGSYTTEELKELIQADPVVVLPVGAYEQHGPHLTLDTDTHIGLEIGKAAVEKSDIPCALLPPVWLGISEHHMHFAGSLTLKQSTLTNLIYDILESLSRHGVKKVLIINSHGGNMGPLSAAISQIGASIGGRQALVTYWNLVADVIGEIRRSEYGGISHGCELETSLKMYLAPQDVRENLLKPNIVKGDAYWSPEMFASNKITIYKPYHELSKDGHVGDPTKATAEMGKIVFETVVERMVQLMKSI